MKTDMLLIFFLGLIVTLTSVCDGHRVGIPKVKHFDWSKFSGPRPWYTLLHPPSDAENDLHCIASTIGSPEGNMSLKKVEAYQVSEQRHVTIYGNATNWNSDGYWDEIFEQSALWTGRYYMLAVDYDLYAVVKFWPIDSNTSHVYVSYRSQHPDEKTVKRVQKELQENNIDVNQLVNWPVDPCQ